MRKSQHEYFTRKALELAIKAKGKTSPNPLVGAVVVKNNRIIGSGYHKKAGLVHAEVEALRQAGRRAQGSTLYVSLEPCCFFGRTPPCTDAIINSGIKKVIIGMCDPNPKNNGRGIKILRHEGISVKEGYLQNELKKINEHFIKYISKKIPFVTIKVGQSLDGKIATKTGDSEWITSYSARSYAKSLRADYDAIMLGINTVINDDPELAAPEKKRFFKIVVDPHLRIPLKSQIIRKNSKSVIIATGLNSSTYKKKALEKLGVKIIKVPSRLKNLNLRYLLSKLASLEITSVLVEGGGRMIGSLLEQHLVDKVLFFIAPKIIGGESAISSVMGKGIRKIKNAIKLDNIKLKQIGSDYLFEAYIKSIA
ncbi:MAG: bifunctional diaminohydroxyphosphoribosylaminopyrimidine deaminase/5-amino-6-(5-phosphoribosylamino)uracil reductase RibD [Candidatus Omnitrophica bacterium]|nr:bifunctional diaminohydroxyphosphoribosylaminopyrimidine deaminase/5-amino-6-(5-phosphoribosylamino)uracil reductase RibD [Candidatus Omnitrophota bacterium]